MKAIKKALSALLCLFLIFGCVYVTAFAEDVKGTITIKNPTTSEATVEGKDFEIYRIFYATTDGQNTSYSWFKDKDDPKVNPFYEYFATVDDADGKPLVEAGKEPSEYSNIQRVINHINTEHPTNFALSQFAEKIHKYIVDNAIQPIDKKTGEDKKTEVVFEDLDYGYYLVYDATEFSDEGTSAVRSAVMVDTVNTDIEITLKANRPELQKQILENDGKTYGEATSSEIGETVTFKITSYIPSHEYYDAYVYYIDDTLPAGLSLDENSVNVTLTSPEGSAITTQNLYTITENKAANSFKVEFEETALIGQNKLKTDTKIEIGYTATVTSEIPFGGTTNTATLTYSNDPNISTSIGRVQDTARVYTYMFVLTKYAIDSTGNVSATARLAGAKFKFYSVDDEGNKTLIKFTETENLKVAGKKMYSVGGDIEEITVLDGDAPGVVTNSTYFGGNLGDITIFGLKEGTYYIEETQAPDGYVTPTDGFTITVSDTIDANGMVSTLTTTVGEHSSTGAIGNYGGESTNYLTWMDVGNTAGSQLPETGGMGTTLFTVLGIVLMAGAAAFFTSRKRSSMA